MCSTTVDRNNSLGAQSESIAVYSDSSRVLCYAHGQSQRLLDAAMSVGDVLNLEVDARNTLTIFLNRDVLTREVVPNDWHFAVGSFGVGDNREEGGTVWSLLDVGAPQMAVTPRVSRARRATGTLRPTLSLN